VASGAMTTTMVNLRIRCGGHVVGAGMCETPRSVAGGV